MADREHLVYQAKLAEQAERYDGELIFILFFWRFVLSHILNHRRGRIRNRAGFLCPITGKIVGWTPKNRVLDSHMRTSRWNGKKYPLGKA